MCLNSKLSTPAASPSLPIAPCTISPSIDNVPIGRSISAARLPSPGVPARVSSGSAPNCCNCSQLLHTNSVRVCTSRTAEAVSTCSRSRRCARSSVAHAATNATQRLRPKRAFQASRSCNSSGYAPMLALTRNTRSLIAPTCTGVGRASIKWCAAAAGSVGMPCVRAK